MYFFIFGVFFSIWYKVQVTRNKNTNNDDDDKQKWRSSNQYMDSKLIELMHMIPT